MAYEFRLPDIGEGVVEGEIVRWLVKEGDEVRQDQPMVEIMTDKATVEIPSPRPGKVLRRMYSEGQVCPVGKVLISIEEAGGGKNGAAAPGPSERAPAPARSAAPAAAIQAGAAGPATNGALATPATRKLARELGVDLGRIAGTGPGGRITSDDVKMAKEGAASARPAAPAPVPVSVPTAAGDVRIPLRGLRKKIAENMSRSKQKAAHFTYVEEVDCTALVQLRQKANARLGA